ncbi:YkgJ family cysteine cluster protein [Pseudoduganella buxea]|uniref:YkgJ family cysteine cluster protein n=1 Tax=Pseudoduganella buxea TaxID=1949069 RepID=A0A6I3SW00_9BURK|nr:YkgJ family cysteine cluster protein [Pseudoduganella buxea]MTV52706.1 hypothetical protein [Pseudoduganella buxea]GGC18777.1 hypothetical protein GCM10011572_45320 [Pseudoduganella buxea]
MNERRIAIKKSRALPEASAGEFSQWLQHTRSAQQARDIGADVPCNECNACCRSSMFIHIRADEIRSLNRIPKQLLFPVPGLAKGHRLMGYDDKGRCPMLVDDRCSIYEDRPQTCRDYDCRIFAATGITLDEKVQAGISAQAKAWRFTYAGDANRLEHEAVRAAAMFLKQNAKLFPPQVLPLNPVQLALTALKVYTVFHKLMEPGSSANSSDTGIVEAIMAAMDQFDGVPAVKAESAETEKPRFAAGPHHGRAAAEPAAGPAQRRRHRHV